MKNPMLSALLIGLLAGLLPACLGFAETPGERFQKVMKEMADLCVSKKLSATDSRCILPKMRPADPLATEEGRFAHSIKIPNPVSADSGYKSGMTPEQYFDHLCKTEAGEFIYRTVENVEGFYLMRPRESVNDHKLQHLYALEDAFAYSDIETDAPQKLFINPPWWRYKFFEIKKTEQTPAAIPPTQFLRYSGYIQNKSSMKIEEISAPKSRYGYTWRGITRPHDRDLGIVGGELIVMELQSNEVLAVRRGFIRSGDVKNNLTGVWWLGGHVCPEYKHANAHTYEFISKVLKPALVSESEGGSNATK